MSVSEVIPFRTERAQFLFQSKRANINSNLRSGLVHFINNTKSSLYCAIYDLRDKNILQALKDLNENNDRTIELKIAYDAGKDNHPTNISGIDPKPGNTQKELEEYGLAEVSTAVHAGGHIMHDKFLIRDGLSVWTGSANFTIGGLDLQDNNCIVIDSQDLASLYKETFNELLNPEHKHPRPREIHDPSPKPGHSIKIGQIDITPYFSPASGEGIEDE